MKKANTTTPVSRQYLAIPPPSRHPAIIPLTSRHYPINIPPISHQYPTIPQTSHHHTAGYEPHIQYTTVNLDQSLQLYVVCCIALTKVTVQSFHTKKTQDYVVFVQCRLLGQQIIIYIVTSIARIYTYRRNCGTSTIRTEK